VEERVRERGGIGLLGVGERGTGGKRVAILFFFYNTCPIPLFCIRNLYQKGQFCVVILPVNNCEVAHTGIQ
jgi:hypothetical protein